MRKLNLIPMMSMGALAAGLLMSCSQVFADAGAFDTRMMMKQTDKEILITMDIPGMDRDRINVEIKEEMLIISGERHSKDQDKKVTKNDQYYHQESSFGSFMQAISLPKDAQRDQIEARYKDGILTVKIARAKKEEKKMEYEKIKVK